MEGHPYELDTGIRPVRARPWMLWLLPRWLSGRRFGRCVLSAYAHVLTLGWLSHSPSTAEDPLMHALIVIILIALVVLGGFL